MRRLVLLLAGGCTSTDDALSVMTDGGSYEITLAAAPVASGTQTLALAIDPEEGKLSEAIVSMPSMGHASDGLLSETGAGRYDVEVELSMAGWWVLDGVVDGEGFQLEFEVP